MALFPMTQFDFPNVSNYDSDLREVLYMCRTLIDEYNGIVDAVNELTDGFEEVKDEFSEVEKQFAEVEKQFDELERLVNNFEQEIDDKIAAGLAEYMATVNRRLAELKTYIDNTITETLHTFEQIIANAYAYSDLKDAEIVAQFNVELAEVNRRIDELIFELPDAYNITKGYETDLIELIYDVYDACRDHAYTAQQFDTAGKTATELDGMNETASNLDVNGYDLLYPVNLVINPFTGEYENINPVLEELARVALGDNSITAATYDGKEISAEDFEAYNMTAYMYDYFADEILAS